jgi:hypothetical protein
MSERKRLPNGKPVLASVVRPSTREPVRPTPELQRLLSKVYDAYRKVDDPALNQACRQDFVFHMTDWLSDLHDLNRLYDRPSSATAKEAESIVYGFLIHAVPHLMAAGRLLEGKELTHPFKYPWEQVDGP